MQSGLKLHFPLCLSLLHCLNLFRLFRKYMLPLLSTCSLLFYLHRQTFYKYCTLRNLLLCFTMNIFALSLSLFLCQFHLLLQPMYLLPQLLAQFIALLQVLAKFCTQLLKLVISGGIVLHLLAPLFKFFALCF
jgi:hypothetical protein